MRVTILVIRIAVVACCGLLLLGRNGVLMDINSLAMAGVGAAVVEFAIHRRRSRSAHGEAFSCQIGDEVFSGRYHVADGQVYVTYGGITGAAPLGAARSIHVAERLLAEMRTHIARSATAPQTTDDSRNAC